MPVNLEKMTKIQLFENKNNCCGNSSIVTSVSHGEDADLPCIYLKLQMNTIDNNYIIKQIRKEILVFILPLPNFLLTPCKHLLAVVRQ